MKYWILKEFFGTHNLREIKRREKLRSSFKKSSLMFSSYVCMIVETRVAEHFSVKSTFF